MMHCTTLAEMACATILLLLANLVRSQTVSPSNNSKDLYPVSISPRFILNGTQLPNLLVHMAPLGEYAEMTHNSFSTVDVPGKVVNVDASSANNPGDLDQFSYLSCDPGAYTGNLDASDVFRIVVNNANLVILYSETSDHCIATGLDNLPTINGILTTTDRNTATMLAKLNLDSHSQGTASILPDFSSYTNYSNPNSFNNQSGFGNSPTTAVAMIILYSITGLITALFVVIIITGAIRAHRHPERYGPRNIVGRSRQSRARGIARAMLETLPIVKFGDRDAPDTTKNNNSADIEMAPPAATGNAGAKGATSTTTVIPGRETESLPSNSSNTDVTANADGSDEQGQLGCSICTEDFTKGEEVRVLPCNHKFHPDCVDPWLLNVSGTCPLCRIDLRPGGEQQGTTTSDTPNTADDGQNTDLPPPLAQDMVGRGQSRFGPYNDPITSLGSSRRDTFANLRRMAGGSRDERIAALRRFRQERRAGTQDQSGDEERRGLTRRLRERFRVLTQRNGGDGTHGTFGEDARRSSFARP